MLEGIGRIGAYVQQKNLKTAAKYRIKTGNSLIPSKTEKLESALKQINKNQSSKDTNSLRTASIKSKLKGGRKLTSEEMNYLREKDPDLYRKAKGAQEAREELERDLSQCHTKAEARQALMRAQLRASNEAMAELAAVKGAGGAGGIGGGFGGVAGGAQAASFDGDMGDMGDMSAEGVAAGADISGDGVLAAEGAAAPATANISANVSTDAGTVNADESGEAAEVNQAVEAKERLAEENAVQQMLSNVLQEINNLMSEVSQADESGENDNNQADGVKGNEEAAAPPATGSSSNDPVTDIIEKLLFKMRAIQNVWDEFTHDKAYKEMPEGYNSEEANHTNGYKFKHAVNDTALMDIINIYNNSFEGGELTVTTSLDILQ
ncbi:hypothetical protein D081_2012 [Anaerovibrio sp. JC8]|uniref:hypothetical protein n=1 Tax=Anaerovibrio sp. JC8 TaxID=1240085 RepID=UPI000A0A61B8|nr:hypothetical protein [Anaerovibrio sp. JC8]ORT99283.1 hypothetical protein D081_2012 [Anaerovibrio sp. JC8]